MAEVFEARLEGPQQFSRQCVIKRLRPELLNAKEQVGHFLEEARLMAQLQHPNLVQVFDLGEADGQYFIAMERIDGPPLSRLLEVLHQAGERLPVEVAVYIAARVGEGLHFAHELLDPATRKPLQIVHRDVSPQNILLGLGGDVKLADFGIAKAELEHRAPTQMGIAKGKPAYMSPEQARALPVDRRTDVFALGVVLWEMLAGTVLFADRERRRRIERDGAPPPSSAAKGVDAELDAIVVSALEPAAKDRVASARLFEEALDRWLADHQAKSPRVTLQRLLEARRGRLLAVEDTAEVAPANSPGPPRFIVSPEARTLVRSPASPFDDQPDPSDPFTLPPTVASIDEATSPIPRAPGVPAPAPQRPPTVVKAGRAAIPLPDAPSAASSLPVPATSFVGRRAELDAIAAAFDEGARVVTLVGPGGTGKTRLALRFAEEGLQRAAFPGGVWHVDVAGARDGAGLLAAVARALGVSPRGARSPTELLATIARALAALGRCLIVVDNAEGLVGQLHDVVGELSRRAPRTRLLFTSQQTLGVAGERGLVVSPLGVPDDEDGGSAAAVSLFLERACAARGGRELPATELGLVAEIVRRLDGVPLAIEIAAARAAGESPAQILADLPRGDAVRALKGAIDDTWRQLAEPEQRAFRRAAVFRGGFDLAAAERVLELGAGTRTREALERLKGRSLLSSRGSGEHERFSMLDALRAFAGERLEQSGERGSVEARHAECFVARGRELCAAFERHDEQADRLLTADAENLAAVVERAAAAPRPTGVVAAQALEAALALDVALQQRGTPADQIVALDRALALAEGRTVPPLLVVRAHLARGEARRLLHDFGGARADLNVASDLAAQLVDTGLEARAHMSLGALALSQGKRELADELLHRALELADQAKDDRTAGRALALVGKVARMGRQLELADQWCRAAVERSRASGDRRDEGRALVELASTLLAAQATDEAAEAARQATELLAKRGDRRSLVHAFGTLAIIELDRGNFEDAEIAAARAVELATFVGDRRAEGLYLGMRGASLHARGKLLDAREHYAHGAQVLLDAGEDAHGAFFQGALGAVYAALEDLDDAHRAFTVARRRLAGGDAQAMAAAVGLFHAAYDVVKASEGSSRRGPLETLRRAIEGARRTVYAQSEEVRFAVRIVEQLL
ncbi:MAG: protein kinase [Deltaproteobacteria bacterium]|nr:protein kinase [Deltaproteobacteria bacterium]